MGAARAQPRGGSPILLRAFGRNKMRFLLGTLLLSVHQLAETAVPIAIGVILDRVLIPGDTDALKSALLAIGGLFLVVVFAWRFGARLLKRAVEAEAHRIRLEVVGRILDPRGIKTRMRVGEMLTVSTQGADNAAKVLDVAARSIAAFVAGLAAAVVLLLIDLPLGLLVIVATPIIVLLLQRLAPMITQRAAAQQAAVGWVSALATDLVSGLRPLRGIGGEEMGAHRYRTQSRIALRAAIRSARVNGMYIGVSHTINGVLAVAVAGFAGYLALTGSISVGELVAVVGLSQFIIEPLGVLNAAPKGIAVAKGSANRLSIVLDAEHRLESGPLSVSDQASSVEANDIRYKSLKGLSFRAAPGELLGVLTYQPQDGEALVAILSGQEPPSEYQGTVRIGTVPMPEVQIHQARRALLVEPHKTDLFSGTIGSNVRAANPDAAPAVVQAVLEASAATDVVAMHEDGLDHPVTDRGSSLSGGQRQRVALARALLAGPPVLVLHDPTTAVDAVTEKGIAAGIENLRHQRGDTAHTTIMVTSSPTLLDLTDRVIVIEDGAVVTEGTHEKLVTSDAHYRKAVLR